MKKFPNYKFVASQAAIFKWMKTDYPKLWENIKKYHVQGQFLPVGGTWVELDGNITGGESMCRQGEF